MKQFRSGTVWVSFSDRIYRSSKKKAGGRILPAPHRLAQLRTGIRRKSCETSAFTFRIRSNDTAGRFLAAV